MRFGPDSTTTKRAVLRFAGAILVAFVGGVAGNTSAEDAAAVRPQFDEAKARQLIEAMLANDAKFDQVRVEYDHTHYPGPPSFSGHIYFSNGKFVQTKVEQPKPRTSRQVLALRWPDVAWEREITGDQGGVREAFETWRSIGHKMESLTVHDYRPKARARIWQHEICTRTGPLDIYQELVLWKKFSLGVGYAEQINKVTALEQAADGFVIHADMEFWRGKICKARLEVDKQLVVRKASIDTHLYNLSAETRGDFAAGNGFRCARSGHFRRTAKGTKQPMQEFDMVLRDVKFDLSDEEFDRVASLVPPVGEPCKVTDQDSERKRFDRLRRAVEEGERVPGPVLRLR